MPYEDLTSPIKGMIGVYFMAMELSRHGLVAVPTIRNTKAVDMLVANLEGTKAVTLQVKTTNGDEFGVASWGGEPPAFAEGDRWLAEQICPGPGKLYAFVQVDSDGVPREYWIMRSEDVLGEVRRIRLECLGRRYKDKSEIRKNRRSGQRVKDQGNWAIEPGEPNRRRLDLVLQPLGD